MSGIVEPMSSRLVRTLGIVVVLALGCPSNSSEPTPEQTDSVTSNAGLPASATGEGGSESATMAGEPETTAVDEPRMDVPSEPTPQVMPCDEVGRSSVNVTAGQTPVGTLAVAHAVFGWDYCCVPNPVVALTVEPAPPGGLFPRPPDYVAVEVYAEVEGIVYEGAYPANVYASIAGEDAWTATGQVEVLTPLGIRSNPGSMDSEARLVARITVVGDGWNFDVDVDAPHCTGYDAPSCPCE